METFEDDVGHWREVKLDTLKQIAETLKVLQKGQNGRAELDVMQKMFSISVDHVKVKERSTMTEAVMRQRGYWGIDIHKDAKTTLAAMETRMRSRNLTAEQKENAKLKTRVEYLEEELDKLNWDPSEDSDEDDVEELRDGAAPVAEPEPEPELAAEPEPELAAEPEPEPAV